MISLLLSIASSAIILIVFKLLNRFKINVFQPIVVNYLVASTLGFVLGGTNPAEAISNNISWLPFSLVIGVLLIGNFYLMGTSTQKAGIAVTSVAAKMAFVIPVLFSLLYDVHDKITLSKSIQLILALIAVFLVVYKPEKTIKQSKTFWLPVILFFGIGFLDAIVKYSQYTFVETDKQSSIFSAVNFGIAAIVGIILVISNPGHIKGFACYKPWLTGTILGIANFGSMYFLINALNGLKINNSLVFGINNIAIICVAVLLALLWFKEKFNTINWIGVLLSIGVLFSMIYSFIA
jgi:drug/metabolite transporter (DMT)-like permease